jgi:hypothetical protein
MGDEDGVDQVKMEDDGIIALGEGQWVKSRRKAKASSLAEIGHTSTSGVWWFGPQNSDGGFEEKQMARGGIEKFLSRRNYLMKGALTVG